MPARSRRARRPRAGRVHARARARASRTRSRVPPPHAGAAARVLARDLGRERRRRPSNRWRSRPTKLLGARRISVWLHDRRASELLLAASSEPACGGERAGRDELRGTRRAGSGWNARSLSAKASARMLIAPLRGLAARARHADDRRRAARPRRSAARRRRARSGAAVSAAIENVQLLEEILRQRRLLEDTFNSLTDLSRHRQRPARRPGQRGVRGARRKLARGHCSDGRWKSSSAPKWPNGRRRRSRRARKPERPRGSRQSSDRRAHAGNSRTSGWTACSPRR